MARAATARGCSRIERFVHDLANGAGTTAALRAAAKATVDLPGRAGPRLRLAGGANIVVGQHVAGADDHVMSQTQMSYRDSDTDAKKIGCFYTLSKLRRP